MAQTQKEHVRAAIVEAATALFAEVGFAATTIALVAERAGSSVGNVYKYFANKDELFAAVLPESFATELRRMTRARIAAVGDVRDLRELPAGSRYHVLAGELLDHCIAHKERVVILLARAEGTPYASFADDFVERLGDWALDYARGAWPEVRHTPALRFAIRRIYRGFVRSMADTLASVRGEAQIREAVFYLTAHHQGGLLHLFESADDRRKSS
jgi:AcrR family transcriptional regulator